MGVHALAWFLFAFAVFNTYMLIGSMQVNTAVFMVFLTLEITEILLVIGFSTSRRRHGVVAPCGWLGRHRHGRRRLVHVGGVLNGVHGRVMLPVGRPFTTARARSMATA